VLYAEELAKLGRRQKAEHVLREVLDRKPEDPTASYGLGELLLERGAEREAVHWLGVAAEQRPREPWRWHRLGQALQASGQPQEAIGAFRVALQQSEPEQVNPWTRWRLAWCLLDVGETEASRRQARDLARRLGVADGPPRDPTLGALRQWLLKLRPRLPSETAL